MRTRNEGELLHESVRSRNKEGCSADLGNEFPIVDVQVLQAVSG